MCIQSTKTDVFIRITAKLYLMNQLKKTDMKQEYWGDGTLMIKALYVNGIGNCEDQNEADLAYHIYDLLSHNEITIDKAIEMIGCEYPMGNEPETVGRQCHIMGYSSDGKLFLTYDSYTGALDVWEVDEWYAQEDDFGKTGEYGMVRSYDIGYMILENCENNAKEMGYDNVEDYLRLWAGECTLAECPFQWQRLGSGYGYHGRTLFEADDIVNGHLVCKEIYGQIMFDAYPPDND